jgi:hypothetical protein
MKELPENLKKDLEDRLDSFESCNESSNNVEGYLASLSKKGYDILDYKQKYFCILEKHFNRYSS